MTFSQVTAQTLADVLILCVIWKMTLSLNSILQALSIAKLNPITLQQWFVVWVNNTDPGNYFFFPEIILVLYFF